MLIKPSSFGEMSQAWLRRILWIPFEKPAVQVRIPDFDKVLLKKEGPGILNWMIQGAIKLITDGIPEDVKARQRVEQLLRDEVSSLYNVSQAHDINRAGRTLRGYRGLRLNHRKPDYSLYEEIYPVD